MTTSDYYKQLAAMTPKLLARVEELEAENERQRAELAEARAAVITSKPAAWLTEKEVEKIFRISASWLQKDRMLDSPLIPFRKRIKAVHYFRGTVEEYCLQNVKGHRKAA